MRYLGATRPASTTSGRDITIRLALGASGMLLAVACSLPFAGADDEAPGPGEPSDASWSIGFGVPYNGSTYVDYEPTYPVTPLFDWTAGRLSLFLTGARWRLLEGSSAPPEQGGLSWSLSGELNIGLMPRDEDESPRFVGMDDRDAETTLGLSAQLAGAFGSLAVVAARDAGGASDGATGSITLARPFVTGPRFQLFGNAGVEMADASHVDHYYGVRADEATVDRPAYRAGAAVSPFVGLTAANVITPRWRLGSQLQVLRLDDDIVESSLTDDDDVEVRAAVALSYVVQP